MPFKSKAQAREMFANQPAIARRWAKMTDFSSLPSKLENPKQSESHETWAPNRPTIKKHTAADDFKHLSPGPKARHHESTPAKEQDSMEEGPVTFVPGSRGRHLDKFKRR